MQGATFCLNGLDFVANVRQNVDVRVISLKALKDFWGRYPDAEVPLRNWYRTTSRAAWGSLQDVRRTYPHADGVRTGGGEALTVFNIAGNKYRLIARIRYDHQLVNIRHVLTHAEYDDDSWKE
ncbi:mRNA interferase HigB [Phycisphaerales bacterium]|nr:mRNA interferase HigB [Phycisphaerales bacterium]